ncbi:MAG: enoyl-CoA hydratase-related protein [Alphaproteobacteria bacterium]
MPVSRPIEEQVQLDTTREGVAVVTLNRPEVHNAINAEIIDRLADIFTDLAKQDGVRVVIIEGAGKSFSAGADLEWMKAAADYTEKENFEDASAAADMFLRLRLLPQPSIALVHGAALGGGVGMIAAADIAIATADAQFGLTEVRLGLVPAVISPYVVEAIGSRAARRYFLTGEKFPAEEAYRLGLVHEVVPDKGALAAASEKIVDSILQSSPAAVARAKRLISACMKEFPDPELRLHTARFIAEARTSDEGREGIAAFLAKRKPKWAQ